MKNIQKLEDELSLLKVKCKCGHVIVMPVYVDTIICRWCKRKVKNNTLAYFKYKIRKKVKE